MGPEVLEPPELRREALLVRAGDGLVGLVHGAVVDGDTEALLGDGERQVLPHDGQPDQPDGGQVLARVRPAWGRGPVSRRPASSPAAVRGNGDAPFAPSG